MDKSVCEIYFVEFSSDTYAHTKPDANVNANAHANTKDKYIYTYKHIHFDNYKCTQMESSSTHEGYKGTLEDD